jgi:hypothetical protein
MFRSRFYTTALGAALLTALVATPVEAAKPIRPPPSTEPPPTADELPLSPEQQAVSDRKVAEARAYLAAVATSGEDLASLACVVPTGTSTEGVPVTTEACVVPQGFLAVEARDQIKGHYCGPAVGQVIANYSWAMPAGANKYTQGQIAIWMGTDVNGGTSSQALANGLETATRGAPRRPAVWMWVVTPLRDDDRDGHLGDELHGFVRANVSGSRMPLAFSLKPYDPFGAFHLVSWLKPVNSPGHWIAAYGWWNTYSNVDRDRARTYYTDSSKDEGGGTGKYWDPTRHIAEMIRVHTGVFVW